MVAFLIFSITIAASNDASLINTCYRLMHLLSRTSVRASTIGTTLTGLLLTILTKWGLLKFYWVIAKEGLTLLVIGLNLWGMYAWTFQAIILSQSATWQGDFFIVKTELWTGIIIQLLSLVLMYIISVFKPWGRRVNLNQIS